MPKSSSMKSSPNRERASRVQSCLPVSVNGVKGVTRDISATGVFFEIDDNYSAGSKIQFELQLDTPGGPLRLVCDGEVVRVVSEGGKSHVAARIISQTIESVPPKTS
jgi:hypothetical protein